jgi:hypothetical protein
MVLLLRCLARADLDYRLPQKHFVALDFEAIFLAIFEEFL